MKVGYWGALTKLGATHLLQPGHNAAIVEEVVTGQLADLLTQCVVVLTHWALQAGACRTGSQCHARDTPTLPLSPQGGSPTCSSVTGMVGRVWIFSLSAGGGPVFSN